MFSREPLRMRLDVLGGDAQLLRCVDRQPEPLVPEGMEHALGGELGERGRLVVATVGEPLDRGGREDVVAAVDPIGDAAGLLEAAHDVGVVDVDEAELRLRLRDRDDLGADTGELLLELRALTGGAREQHTAHAGIREPTDLIGGERLPGNVDERLRPSAGSVTEPLGLAAGEDDRFHPGYPWGAGAGSGVSGSTSVGDVGRPMPSYANPAIRVASGSSRFRPSTISGFAIAVRTSSDASPRSSSHSVTITAASAPRTASSTEPAISTPFGSLPTSATGSQARTSAPSARRRDASTIDGASRMSSVFALNAVPSSATVLPRNGPRRRFSFPITRRFC